jgi:hypothetical protein
MMMDVPQVVALDEQSAENTASKPNDTGRIGATNAGNASENP